MDDSSDSTMLSRRHGDTGKMLCRIDIPVSEQQLESVIVHAAQKGFRSKTEFSRDVVLGAVQDGYWLPLKPEAQKALEVLAVLNGVSEHDLVVDLLEGELMRRLAMVQMMTKTSDFGNVNGIPSINGSLTGSSTERA